MTIDERTAAQEKFLKAFSMTANVRAACLQAGIDRTLVYQWKEHDEVFGLRFNLASEDANDMIRAELFRRAVQGVEKPVVSMGRVVYQDGTPLMVREYSDNLLSLLAKARMPEFREKTESTGADALLALLTSEHLSLLADLEGLAHAGQKQTEDSAPAADSA